jgi:hypothetical protein
MTIFEYLGISKDELINLDISRNYLTYFIKKSDGKRTRRIDAPSPSLKLIQKTILRKLLYTYRAHDIAHGFVIGRSPKTNAEAHIGKKYIVKIDIKDFFASITIDTVIFYLTYLLKKQKKFDIPSKEDIELLAKILCFNGSLPQGAPTSPTFTNIVCYGLDIELDKLQKTHTCTITRYADDITASFNDSTKIYSIIQKLIGAISIKGFNTNSKKLRVCSSAKRQRITGIVVNQKLNTPKESWRNLRATLHQSALHGITEKDAQKLRGQIEWLRTLNYSRGIQFLKKFEKLNVTPHLNTLPTAVALT